MFRKQFALVVLLLLVATAGFGQDTVYRSAYHDYRIVTVAEGLETPWSMAFLPDGDMLITEREGRLRIVRDGWLLADPVAGVPEVVARGQGGLMDVVPHPDFATNRLLYLSYSRPVDDGETERRSAVTAVVRGRFENDAFTDVEDIFVAVAQGRAGHFGSRLAFDGNGYLFITAGDRQAPPRGDLFTHPAQDLSNHQGVVIRLHDDGRVPDDNPFVDNPDALPEIYSYGHRNPQGLVIDPNSGDIWITEHGPQGGDELNLVQPGLNYGWPVIGYGVNYGAGNTIHASTSHEGMETPVHFWVPSIATSGLLLYTGDKFPHWRGNIFAGGLAGQQLARLTMEEQSVVAEETIVLDVMRIRDVRQGPDGYIYIAFEDRRGGPSSVVRLEPADS